jgi:hypothetical protein
MWADYKGGRERFRLDKNAEDRQALRMQELKNEALKTMLADKLSALSQKAAASEEGYASEADIPKMVGGMPLKGVKVGKGNMFLPEYEQSVADVKPTPGFVVVGGKVQKDPDYINVMDQRKIYAEKAASAYKEEVLRDSAQQNLNAITEAKKGAKYFGPMGNVPTIFSPSTLQGEYGPRQKWESNVNKLLSQKVIDVMGEMKRVSKTGATGFGQLSEKELEVLKSASTALNRGLTPEDAMGYLDEMEKIHRKVLNPIPAGGLDGLKQATQQAVASPADDVPPEIQALLAKGHKIVGVRNG